MMWPMASEQIFVLHINIDYIEQSDSTSTSALRQSSSESSCGTPPKTDPPGLS